MIGLNVLLLKYNRKWHGYITERAKKVFLKCYGQHINLQQIILITNIPINICLTE